MKFIKVFSLLPIILILTACSTSTYYSPQNNFNNSSTIINNIENTDIKKQSLNIEGKFKIKTTNQKASGVFSGKFYDDSWILELQTPIYTSIANVVYGKSSIIDDYINSHKNVYVWEELPFYQNGMTLPPQLLNNIIHNLNNKDDIIDILQNTDWQLLSYEKNQNNITFELSKNNDISLKLFILN